MTITEVYNTLVHSKQTGTCGLDGIDGKILKLLVPAVSDTQTYVYNLCIQKCHAPAAFKQAKVIPLSKSGKRSDPWNYKPISVLSVLSKPFEKDTNVFLHIYF